MCMYDYISASIKTLASVVRKKKRCVLCVCVLHYTKVNPLRYIFIMIYLIWLYILYS